MHIQKPETARSNSSTIQRLILTLNSKGTDRFHAAKELNLIAQQTPELLYPKFEVLADLLESKSSVLLWNGLLILGHLARVDQQRRLDNIIDKYLSHLWDNKLVTAANVIIGCGQILKFRPDLGDRILQQMLGVDEIPLPTSECHEVMRGHVLSVFGDCFESVKDDGRVVEFILRCAQSSRPSTKKRAEELIRKLS